MADNVVLNPGAGGATVASDEISGSHYQRVKLIHGVDGTNAGDVARSNPFPVDIHGFTAPVRVLTTSVGLAAGASIDLDSNQISSGKTGKLVSLIACSTVPIKIDLKTVSDGVPSSPLAVLFGMPAVNVSFPVPHKDLYTVAQSAGAGFDGFRVTVTNLDINQAADVYCNYIYDEV